MKEKIEQAKEIIRMVARHYRRPVIYCSFGKDSICAAHLCRSMGYEWPVVFHQEAEFPRKFKYQREIVEAWNITVMDYPPSKTSVYYRPGAPYYEVATHFDIGGGATFILLGVLYEPEAFVAGKYLCALKDLYEQPTCRGFDYRWDVGIRGDKDADAHPHTGKPFKIRPANQLNIGCVDFAFPLNGWTDQDVTQYIIDNGIPINHDIYEMVDGVLTNKEDKSLNADYRPACFRCMKSDAPESVMCPRLGVEVNNVWPMLDVAIAPEYLEDLRYV